MTQAEAIKALRDHLGLSQQSFAVNFGISMGALRHYEAGRRAAPLEVLLQMAFVAEQKRLFVLREVFLSNQVETMMEYLVNSRFTYQAPGNLPARRPVRN